MKPYTSPPRAEFSNLPRMLGALAVVCIGVPLAAWGIVSAVISAPGATLFLLAMAVSCLIGAALGHRLDSVVIRELERARNALCDAENAVQVAYRNGVLAGEASRSIAPSGSEIGRGGES